MKKAVLIISLFSISLLSKAADYYWVGGTGNWSEVGTHWATTSGGGTFYGSVPTSADNVFFDANSFSSSSQTITLDITSPACNDMTWTGVTNTPTFNGNNKVLNVYGSLTFISGITVNALPVTFQSVSTGKTITTAGKTLGTVTFNGSTGGWTFQDAFTATNIYHNYGTLNTNNQTVNVVSSGSFFSETTNTRSLILGTSILNIDVHFLIRNSTGLTLSAASSTINVGLSLRVIGQILNDVNFLNAGAEITEGGNNTFNNVTFASSGSIKTTGNTFNNVSFSGNATISGSNSYNNLTFGTGKINTFTAGTTQTVAGTLTSSGSCAAFSTFTSTTSSAATISKASGTVIFDYINLSNMTVSGGATFTVNNAINLGGNTGWTFNTTTPKNIYWVGGTGNWSETSHWSLTSGGSGGAVSCVPTSVDNVFFDANSFSGSGQTVTLDISTPVCNDMTWTGATNTPTFNGNNKTMNIYGSLTLISGITVNTLPVTFQSVSTGKTITTAGKTLGTVTFNASTGGWTIQDALTATFIQHDYGTLNTNNQTVNIVSSGSFKSETSNTRTLILGTSILNIDVHFLIRNSTGLTLSAASSTINVGLSLRVIGQILNDVNFLNAGAEITEGGNNTFNNVTFASSGSIKTTGNTFNNVIFGGNATFTVSSSFNNLTFYPGTTNTLQAGSTQTVSGSITAIGTGSSPITIQSSSSTAATISKPSGIICLDFIQLQNIAGTGGATFNAGANSTNLGGNTGFVFNGGCTLPSYPTSVWYGTNSSTWATTTNWSPIIVPVSGINVTINPSSNTPIISTTQAVNNLTINSSASLTVTGTLKVANSINNSGTLTATSGTIEMNGTAAQTIPASTFSTNTVQNLIINNTAGVTLGGALNITGTLTPTAGALNTGGFVTLKSNASGTARIAPVLGSISGNVIAERYVAGGTSIASGATPGKRGFRFISHPFNSNPTLTILISGGLSITGPTGQGFTNNPNPGATNSPTAFYYDPTVTNAGSGSSDPGWMAYTNANTQTWNKMQGIRVLYRGTGTQGLNGTSSYTLNDLTLNMTGAVNTGAQTFTLPATADNTTRWSLVGNPYPSQINIQGLLNAKYNSGAGNIGASAYVYNPNKSNTNRGGYDMIDLNSNGGGSPYILPMYGVVLVQNTVATSHTISFSETDKIGSATNLSFRGNEVNNAIVLDLVDENGEILDQTFIRFNNQAKDKFESRDGGKMLNNYSIYSVSSDHQILAIDSRPEPKTASIIPLGIQSSIAKIFRLRVSELELPNTITVYLKDKFKNTLRQLDLNTVYDFEVTTDANTQGSNRFEIVMQKAPPPPITKLSVTVGPNPSTDFVQVKMQAPKAELTSIRIVGVDGKTVELMNLGSVDQINKQISVKRFVAGTYLLQVVHGAEIVTKQIIKQ